MDTIFAKWIEADKRFSFAEEDNGGVEISKVRHAELIALEASGKFLVAGNDGAPVAVETPGLVQADLIAARLAQMREVREKILNRLGDIAGRADRAGDATLAGACDTAALALLDITENLPLTLAEVEAEVTNRYGVIARTAINTAPSLATAFSRIDL